MIKTADCSVCGGRVKIPADVELNEILTCGECEAKVEIVSLGSKVKLEEVKIEEDWGE